VPFKLYAKEQKSLFGEILDWMLTPLLLLWPITLALTWWFSQGVASVPYDRALGANTRAVANLVSVRGEQAQTAITSVSMPASTRDVLRADEADAVYFQVLGARGEFVAGERDLPLPPEGEKPVVGELRFRDADLELVTLRVAYTWVRLGPADAKPVLVQVAETRDKRATLAADIMKGAVLPQFLTIPLAILMVWFALERSLRPVRRLEQRIKEREVGDLSPIDETAAPQELAPMVKSVNTLMSRMSQSLISQRRFLADAAHQLKTPLAGLRMQAELALKEGTDASELKQSLRQISHSSVRATHTVNQLLALARVEGVASLTMHPVNLVSAVAEAVAESLPQALDKRIDLGYEGPSAGEVSVRLRGNPTLVKEMVRNLIDNAVAYTPEGGIVTARLWVDPFSQTQIIQVEDNGPGIPVAERELVIQPFYRPLGNAVDGSGLGLAIVVEIAKQHGGKLTIEDAKPGAEPPGTHMTLTFAAQGVVG
jgi:two-component system sensor histidine kinase TctE